VPKLFYAGIDLGLGVRGINSPDPVNPQDAATKHYVDNLSGIPTPAGGSYWEKLTQNPAEANNYGGGWANGPGLPPTVTITKRFASTKIRCKIFNIQSVASNNGGFHYWGVAVNGGAIQQITQFYYNRTGVWVSPPFGVTDFVPANYSQVNTTGSMQVVWYIQTSAGCNWQVNAGSGDQGPGGLISEVP
jgi:hypothetical protein